MPSQRSPGRRTTARVQIPPARLASRSAWSHAARRLDVEETRAWNDRNRDLLDLYGLRIESIVRQPLVAPRAGGPSGRLQTELMDRLLMSCLLGALSVSASGRGDLLGLSSEERDRRKRSVKENNDRNSTAAMSEALHALCDSTPDVRLEIAIGEGARKKPGEKGGNPTLYSGQKIGTGDKTYSLAVDVVEGTTKSTTFDHSSGTLLYATEATIAPVPDIYFDKCQLHEVDGVTVADPLERIVEAVMDARGTHEVNFFALERPRHPIERMVAIGANMRTDTDGDAYPAVAAGLAWGVFPDNMRPLDGVAGNIGGAAETIASAAGARYLGVRSTARFCATKISDWDRRYDFGPGEEEELTRRGFDPVKVYSVEDLVPEVATRDGIFIAGAISDNWHIPGLGAAFVGGNFASVSGLVVGAGGGADLYEVTFAYRADLEKTIAGLTPVLTRLLGLDPSSIPAEVRRAAADPVRARRLRHELATSYYMHMQEAGGGRPRLDLDAAEKVESAEALAVLRAATEAAPDWFA